MAKKRSNLESLNTEQDNKKAALKAIENAVNPKKQKKNATEGKTRVTVIVNPDKWKVLKVIAIEQDITITEVLDEGIDYVLGKYKPNALNKK